MEDWTNELVKEKEQVVYVNCNDEDKVDIVKKIYYTHPINDELNCLYIGSKDELLQIVKEIFVAESIKISDFCIHAKSMMNTNVYFDVFEKYNEDRIRGKRYDACIIDTPFNCNDVKYAPIPICKKCIRIIPKQIKIINSPSKILNETKQYNIKNQIELEVRQLFQELLLIKPNSNNTMTREKIINMISKLVEMKEKL